MKEEPVDLQELKAVAGGWHEILEFSLNRRAEIKRQQDALEMEVKHLNTVVLDALVKLDVKTVVGPVGSYTYSHTRRSSFDKDKMKKSLLKLGVAAQVVKDSVEAATSFKEYDSVTFRTPEVKGETG